MRTQSRNQNLEQRSRAPHPMALAGLSLTVLGIGYMAKVLGPMAPFATVVLFVASFLLGLGAFHQGVRRWLRPFSAVRAGRSLTAASLVLAGLAVAVIPLEAFLWVAESFHLGRRAGEGVPEKWRLEQVEVAGAKSAHTWHGEVFVFDDLGMRRTQPLPPRRGDVGRVAVVGDSMTYGYGVAADATYSAVLETLLREHLDVEVLNLGVCGYSSEDVVETARELLPLLEADLVVYGICLNDLLPRGLADDQPRVAWVPAQVQVFLGSRTRLGRWLNESYRDALVGVGVRHDFFEDILTRFGEYSLRFGADLVELERLTNGIGLPPVVAMVLDQNPQLNGRGHRICREVERLAGEAGMRVVGSEDYYREHDGQQMPVSSWEGHPNTEAHRIFAERLAAVLRTHPALARYRIDRRITATD